MITKRKVILCSRDKRMLALMAKFEAVEVISDATEAEKIWRFNKIPIIFGEAGNIEVPSFDDENFEKRFTSWANENGLDPGELCTGKSYNTSKEPCILCKIANYGGGTSSSFVYNRTCKREVDCVLYETMSFIVISELGALKQGFLMIVPKRHYLSVAQFPPEIYQEYQEVCEDVEQILIATFGTAPVAFFEHGSGLSGMTSHPKSIVHAHVHVLHDFAMRKSDLDRIQAKPLDDITRAKTTHYFSYKCGARGQLYCCLDDRVYVPRQYARQIIANELGYTPGQYNWRKHKFDENINATLYRIWCMLKSSNLCKRINERTDCFVSAYGQREGFNEH